MSKDIQAALKQTMFALEEVLANFEISYDPDRDDKPGYIVLVEHALDDARAAIGKPEEMKTGD